MCCLGVGGDGVAAVNMVVVVVVAVVVSCWHCDDTLFCKPAVAAMAFAHFQLILLTVRHLHEFLH